MGKTSREEASQAPREVNGPCLRPRDVVGLPG